MSQGRPTGGLTTRSGEGSDGAVSRCVPICAWLISHPERGRGVSMAGQGSQGGVHFGVLGELQAERDGAGLALGPFKQRVVLALLLCNANNIVPVGQLTE